MGDDDKVLMGYEMMAMAMMAMDEQRASERGWPGRDV